MTFPIEPPIEPMLAALQREIPRGDGWLYEPKWDGFRAIVFRDGDRVHIGSRKELPLERYFPEIVEVVKAALPARAVADGEIILPGENGLEFELLQLRLHPAESRVRKLAAEIPATFVPFDLLATDDDLREQPFADRRARLVDVLKPQERCFVTPQTDDAEEAERWFERFEGAGLDGVVAMKRDLRYVPGERVMVKVKHERTADCVVGGYRLAKRPELLDIALERALYPCSARPSGVSDDEPRRTAHGSRGRLEDGRTSRRQRTRAGKASER